ncbi:hypothetical protein SAMN05216525_11176 [Bradyrhizobium sp. Gha]|nr:hypothetical protein SAMN05216525_11176 [Bradyrhizobium sp. Gha]
MTASQKSIAAAGQRSGPAKRTLDVRAHVARKLPHHIYETVRRDIGEMPGKRVMGPFKLDFGRIWRHGFASRLGGDLQRMSFSSDSFLRRIEERLCNRRWEGPALRLVPPFDQHGKGIGIALVLAEDLPQQIHHEIPRRLTGILKNQPNGRGHSANLMIRAKLLAGVKGWSLALFRSMRYMRRAVDLLYLRLVVLAPFSSLTAREVIGGSRCLSLRPGSIGPNGAIDSDSQARTRRTQLTTRSIASWTQARVCLVFVSIFIMLLLAYSP